jgi:hypothetical protein
MKAKIDKKILNYEKLFNVMEKNLDKWSHINQFKSTYDDFVLNLKKLNDLKSIIEKDFSETNKKLTNLEKELRTKLVPVTNLLELYAVDKNKKALKKKMINIRRKVDKLSAEGLDKSVVEIADYADKKLGIVNNEDKNKIGLEDYGLSVKLLDELKTDNESYADLRARIRAEKKELQKATEEVKMRIKENEKILKRRFKKFMSIFENSDPVFFEAYLKATNPKTSEETKKEKTEKPEKPEKNIAKVDSRKNLKPPIAKPAQKPQTTKVGATFEKKETVNKTVASRKPTIRHTQTKQIDE